MPGGGQGLYRMLGRPESLALPDHDPRPVPFDPQVGRFATAFDPRWLPRYRFDVIVLGSGVAGSSVAIAAADRGASVALVVKAELSETNTRYAQGGVAAVWGPDDSFAAHVADTLRVGCGLSEPAIVEEIVRGGPAAIQALIEGGAQFDRDAQGRLDLSREGGHSFARIVHTAGPATGRELQRVLQKRVSEHPNVIAFEKAFAIDLLVDADSARAHGVLVRTQRDEFAIFCASEVVLATGGAGQLYRETTNPQIATGDGIALAFRAGAALRDLEFYQFHPTCLYIAGAARVLISEIVRGAGGVLRDKHGKRFMLDYHVDAELAPRDVVSRACYERMVETSDTSVYLDLSAIEGNPHELFPGIARICGLFGIDIARDPVPVRPGAHFMVGGILTDGDGRTSLEGLWAVGECACIGLHGANRMGSNSLLEGLVIGARVGELAALSAAGSSSSLAIGSGGRRGSRPLDVHLSIEDMTYSLKSLMWRQMGIVRSEELLRDALDKILFWTRAVRDLAQPEPRSFELLNMLTLAQLAARCALERRESRGVHYRSDYPERDPIWRAHSDVLPELSGEAIVRARLLRTAVADPVPQA